MAHRVERAFRPAALRLIPAGSGVLAAVSGGADSVALLHLLVRLAPGRSLELHVAHLDHGLRRGSRADRRFVEQLAHALGLPCTSDRREVERLRRRGESPEEAARRVRREFLIQAAAQARLSTIATGHTLDDQAETVLMRLVRGAGSSALAGMAEAGPGPFVRPLLGLERGELRAYLAGRGLTFREDPSNRNLRFDRNRVRRLVLPLLAETLNPRAARHLVKAAEFLREDSAYLDGRARAAFARIARTDRAGRLRLEAGRLARAAPPLGKRVARIALQQAGVDPRRIASRHVEALMDLARQAGPREAHLPGGLTARRAGPEIVLAPSVD